MAVWTRVANADFLEGILQCQRVDHRGQHAHVIARGALDAAFASRQPAIDIASADDDDDLHAERADLGDLLRHVMDRLGTDAHRFGSAQSFAAQFDQDSTVFRFERFHDGKALDRQGWRR